MLADLVSILSGITAGGVCKTTTRSNYIYYSGRTESACSSSCSSSNFRCGSPTLFTVYTRYSTYQAPQLSNYQDTVEAPPNYSQWTYLSCIGPRDTNTGNLIFNITLLSSSTPAECLAECSKPVGGISLRFCGTFCPFPFPFILSTRLMFPPKRFDEWRHLRC
jgi:hypothetical protein